MADGYTGLGAEFDRRCNTSPDRANALLPYVLIPQLILGGGILDVQHGPLSYLAMALSPVYWAYRAVHLGAGTLPPASPGTSITPMVCCFRAPCWRFRRW